jgi:hypothetical protein
MEKTKKSNAFSKFLIVVYIILTLTFLVESALPGEISSLQSMPMTKIFATLGITPTLKLEDGTDATEAELYYDADDDTGTLLRVIPGGAQSVASVVSENSDVIKITEHRFSSQ